jgi:hypothetical protein
MAAGLGFIEFSTGDVLSAAAANGYLASQTVMVFASAAARTSAIASPQEGMVSFLKDTDTMQFYTGAAWSNVDTGSSPLTTKGDLYGFSTTNARVPVGTNGQILTADSTAATGVAWATAAAGSTFVGCSVKRSTNKSISTATWTKVDFTAENFDTNGFHDNTTNNTRLTIPSGQGGYYLITWNALFAPNNTGYRAAAITKNNEAVAGSGVGVTGGIGVGYTPAGNQLVLNLAAADYIEMQVEQTSGGALTLYGETEWPSATILTLSRLGS